MQVFISYVFTPENETENKQRKKVKLLKTIAFGCVFPTIIGHQCAVTGLSMAVFRLVPHHRRFRMVREESEESDDMPHEEPTARPCKFSPSSPERCSRCRRAAEVIGKPCRFRARRFRSLRKALSPSSSTRHPPEASGAPGLSWKPQRWRSPHLRSGQQTGKQIIIAIAIVHRYCHAHSHPHPYHH